MARAAWIFPIGLHYNKKVAHTRLPSVGFRRWSRFLAVSMQVTWVINLAVGCHYFPPGLQLPPKPLRGLLPIWLLGEQRHNGCEQFAKTVTRQRRDCDLNPCPSAPESNRLTTRLSSHPHYNKSTNGHYNKSIKITVSLGDPSPLLIHNSLAQPSPYPTRQALWRFSRFCRAHACVQRTHADTHRDRDRQAHRQRYICNNVFDFCVFLGVLAFGWLL